MTGKAASGIMTAAVLGLAMSGCFEETGSMFEPFLIDEPRGFSATVTSISTGTVGYMNLSGPVQIAASDGSLVEAYLYEQAIPFEGEYQRAYHYLDGDLRQMVFVLGCGYMAHGCESYKAWVWEDEGALGPDGLWYPNLMHDEGDLLSRDAGHLTSVPWEADLDAQGRLVLKVQPPTVEGDTFAYRYTEGRALPDGWRFTVEEYEDHGPLAPIAKRPLPGPPLPPRPWEGLMFPGEHEDSFAVGATHIEIVTHAFPNVASEADTCIQRYAIEPEANGQEPNDTLPLPVPAPGSEVTARARVTAVQGQTEVERNVVVTRNLLDGSIGMARSEGNIRPTHSSCEEMYKSPWPTVDLNTAMANASDLVGADDLLVFKYELGFMARYRDQGPEHGLHSYRFDFIPEWVSGPTYFYEPYRVHFASSGPLTTLGALAHPDITFER